MAIFLRLEVSRWRQFQHVDINFHPRLTILTGANGAGKTTILHLLNRHWGWDIQYVATPFDDGDSKSSPSRREFWSGFWNPISPARNEPVNAIGKIEYSEHPQALLTVPYSVAETFQVSIQPMPTLPGVYVPSHRPLYIHQRVEQIPTEVNARRQIFDNYFNEMRARWNVKGRVHSPSHVIKQSLMSLAVFGFGSEAVETNWEARQTFEGFEQILSIVLPKTLKFRSLKVRVPNIILKTGTGDIPFDAMSGGVSALIDISWQVYLYSKLANEFVVAIDEPEAHLHPALQRTVLPNLLEAFPLAQFIIATHNPLVVGSIEDSAVYVLSYGEDDRVVSHLLDRVNKAGTANEILREALGLESTSAVWVEGTLQQILDRYADRPLTRDTLRELRSELGRLGLSKFLPETIDRLPK
jgi:hypothetical protein